MKRKIVAGILAGVVAMSSFVGCGDATAKEDEQAKQKAQENQPVDESGKPSPLGKYEEPITMEYVQAINPTDSFPEGESANDNYYTRTIKENMNIDMEVKWAAASADYGEKLNLAIASNDLPDILSVNEQQFQKLIESDMIEDLTDVYDKYACDIVKDNMDATEGAAMDAASRDGKMYGIPQVQIETDTCSLMWIRQDWLDELNLEVPKSIEELEAVAKAFVENEMGGENTIGILGPSLGGGMYDDFMSRGNVYTFDNIFAAYQSYPGFWVEDENGKVNYGSITPETKEALGELQKMYKEGILDQELGVRKSADEACKSGKAGILFFPWWFGYNVKDAVANDPDTEWRAYPAAFDKDGKWNVKFGSVGGHYVVVRKGYEHPEAAILLTNFFRMNEGKFAKETTLDVKHYPGRTLIVNSDESSFTYKTLQAKMKGEEIPEFDPVSYKLLETDLESLDKVLQPPYEDLSIDQWNMEDPNFPRLYSILIGQKALEDAEQDGTLNKIHSVTYRQTATMEKRWENLRKKEDETFLKIIIGEEPLDSFDTFVKEWKEEGGDEIIKEIQEIKDRKK